MIVKDEFAPEKAWHVSNTDESTFGAWTWSRMSDEDNVEQTVFSLNGGNVTIGVCAREIGPVVARVRALVVG